VDFDWKTIVEDIHTVLNGAREMWRALSPLEQKRIGALIAYAVGLLAMCLPVVFMVWRGWRAKMRRSVFLGNQIAHVQASQAVDLWYQESRRYLDGRTTALKSISTGAGLGLAAVGTILAIAEAPRMLLYPAAYLLLMSFAASLTAQLVSTSIYRAQANELSKRIAGANPEDIVAFELIRPLNLPRFRKAGVIHFLALMWMSAGWLFLLTAVMTMSMP